MTEPTTRRARTGALSDGEILARLDTISTDLHEMRTDVLTWRAEVVSREVYEADQRTAKEVRERLEDRLAALSEKDDTLGLRIIDLEGEATRRARERRSMWAAITAAVAGAVIAGTFGFVGAHRAPVVCVTSSVTNLVSCR
jgi:hypothetical protein